MDFLVIQHLDIEPPALIGELLSAAGHSLRTLHVDTGDSLPADTSELRGVIIMGGPQSANATHLTYIRDELQWLKKRVDEGLPMMGICLGAQLMAKAAGAVMIPSPVRELGWFPIYHTIGAEHDPLFRDIPNTLTVFQWHGETFALTDRMTLLATHPDVPAQVFRLGQAQYGLQCHVEVNASMIESWVAYGTSEREHLGIEGISLLHKNTSLYLEPMQHYGRQIVANWLQSIAEYGR